MNESTNVNHWGAAWLRYFGPVIVMAMLVACATSTSPTPSLPTAEPASVTRGGTPTASPTVAATATSTAAAAPTATPTATPAPTLTADQEMAFVREMLATNGGCELPCWWGITPGETGYQEMWDHFSSQGILVHYSPRHKQGYLAFSIPDEHPDYGLDAGFDISEGMVNSITVSAQLISPSSEAADRFTQHWRSYGWDQIMRRHGPPSRIEFGIDASRVWDDHGAYGLILYYESLGMATWYMGPAPLAPADASVMQACPNFSEVGRIDLYLVPADESIAEHIIELTGAYGPGPTLEETTGMSIQTFYETFTDPDSNQCLEQPLQVP